MSIEGFDPNLHTQDSCDSVSSPNPFVDEVQQLAQESFTSDRLYLFENTMDTFIQELKSQKIDIENVDSQLILDLEKVRQRICHMESPVQTTKKRKRQEIVDQDKLQHLRECIEGLQTTLLESLDEKKITHVIRHVDITPKMRAFRNRFAHTVFKQLDETKKNLPIQWLDTVSLYNTVRKEIEHELEQITDPVPEYLTLRSGKQVEKKTDHPNQRTLKEEIPLGQYIEWKGALKLCDLFLEKLETYRPGYVHGVKTKEGMASVLDERQLTSSEQAAYGKAVYASSNAETDYGPYYLVLNKRTIDNMKMQKDNMANESVLQPDGALWRAIEENVPVGQQEVAVFLGDTPKAMDELRTMLKKHPEYDQRVVSRKAFDRFNTMVRNIEGMLEPHQVAKGRETKQQLLVTEMQSMLKTFQTSSQDSSGQEDMEGVSDSEWD